MKIYKALLSIISIFFFSPLFLYSCTSIKNANRPFSVKQNLFDQAKANDLGLPIAEGTESITIFKPDSTSNHFSNGVVMTGFKGKLYCMWQSSPTDEDSPGTWVAYSHSKDGKNWLPPTPLAKPASDKLYTSGGWWIYKDTLIAYINVWPSNLISKGGYTLYTTSADGENWSDLKPVLMNNGDTLKAIFEQDPRVLPEGRIVGAAHFQPGLIVSPIYTDDPSGVRGWQRANFTNLSVKENVSREIEPSCYLRKDGAIIMVFRDQNNSFLRLASVSHDRGESWSTPVLTNMPDSRSKQSAGNIGDSIVYLVGNPVNNKLRIPLVVTLSKDGELFNTAYLLRAGGSDLQALRYNGLYKRPGYHYPKSMIWNSCLYVSYATNKEDVEFTRVPIKSLVLKSSRSKK